MAVGNEVDVASFADAVGLGPGLLGGKGAGLAAMWERGFPVPPGFIMTTRVCNEFRSSKRLSEDVRRQVGANLAALEEGRGRRIGDTRKPLLLAVRSGAPVSMPGMMDTILNLGLNDQTVVALGRECGEEFAFDCYARFLQCFAAIVLRIPTRAFAAAAALPPRQRVSALRAVVAENGGSVPQDPRMQLEMAIVAVLQSWDNPRAFAYRELEGIDSSLGTAVVVQSMVFGNRNGDSATGVVFTRNPNTGAPGAYGDILFRAQGEDVVSGAHTTEPIAVLADRLPAVWVQLTEHMAQLEAWRKDMLDIEFTVEDGRLYLLQVRTGKRSPAASVRIAQAFVEEGLIDPTEALLRVAPEQLEALSRARKLTATAEAGLGRGLAACPGLATGQICLSSEAVADCVDGDAEAILVRTETSPDDIHGMSVAAAIVTARGGLVSHAAVVARGLAVPAVVGVAGMSIDIPTGTVRFGSTVLSEGDTITVDGDEGIVYLGVVDTDLAGAPDTATFLSWADAVVDTAETTAEPGERLAAAHRVIADRTDVGCERS